MPDRDRFDWHHGDDPSGSGASADAGPAEGDSGPAARAPSRELVVGPWVLGALARPEGRAEPRWWWFDRRPDSIVVVLGEVSAPEGAGPLGALVVAAARAELLRGASLIETFRAAHDALLAHGGAVMPAVALELRADGSVTICSAGAAPLLFCDASGARQLVTRGAPLGGSAFVCGVRREQLPPGARILAHSEGVVGAVDVGARAPGVHRLMQALEGVGALPAHRAVQAIDAELAALGGAAADERTLLLIERA